MSEREVGADGLVRTLGAVAAGAFVVTNMIGSGIFTGVAPVEWTPDLLREKGVHSAKNETTVRAGVPASNS